MIDFKDYYDCFKNDILNEFSRDLVLTYKSSYQLEVTEYLDAILLVASTIRSLLQDLYLY